MSNLDIGLIGIAAAFVLVLIRMPIGIALAGVSFCGLWAMTSGAGAFGLLRSVPYQFVANWSFSAIPMFLLMGFIASHSGLSSGLFRLARLLLFRVPGGLACSSVGACAFFAAASGSSVATAAGMGRIAIPEMLAIGYNKAARLVEQMEDEGAGRAHTAHPCEPVPLIYVGKRPARIREGGVLADVANAGAGGRG